jgi:hypothetical protein
MRRVRPDGVRVTAQNRFILHDHGPLGLGGLRFFKLPPGGLVIEKCFVPPERFPPWLATAKPVFRLPVSLSPGARLGFRLTHGGQTVTAEHLAVVRDRGIQWLRVALDPLAPTEANQPFILHLVPVKGEIYVGFDTLRNYGRTRILDSAGKELDLGVEAAAELIWTRTPENEKRSAAAPGRDASAPRDRPPPRS